ncbi:MAG: IgA Peptidase M64 [Tannerella sp.]|jgi:hypothetical protein|nr:IgA Peptidase M64 [Tannerella sp.]
MRVLVFLLVFFSSVVLKAQDVYNQYFTDKQLRIDFALSGNVDFQAAALIQLREEPVWSGPRKNLIDPFEFGGYMLTASDKASGKRIYSRGFNTLFEEWRATEQAKTETQSWTNSVVMPFPKDTVEIKLLARNRDSGAFDTLMRLDIDPKSIFIDRGKLADNQIEIIQSKGKPHEKVDLVFVAEGYTAAEKDKFMADAKRFTDSLFVIPPFAGRRDDFNVTAVFVESADKGTDLSGKGIFQHTAFNSGFYTFATERYLTTSDMKSIRDAVWNVPCDAIFMLVNSSVYGGGGMYNFYSIGTADNEQTIHVFVHEFGHSFAGLADEYFYDDDMSDFYNRKVEPWEPNITTLVDFSRKWKKMLSPKTPIPTPLKTPYAAKLGVFEGGGYTSKGVYRPSDHCMMRDYAPFCPVCNKTILQMIDFWTDK